VTLPPAVGTGLVFKDGYGDFLADHLYGIAALHNGRYFLVEIDLKNRAAAKHLRTLAQPVMASLELDGLVKVEHLPVIPKLRTNGKVRADADEGGNLESGRRVSWSLKLKPMIDAAPEIFASQNPVATFNTMANAAGLHVSRARENFFWLAVYAFDEDCLAPAYWNSGIKASGIKALGDNEEDNSRGKRGRKVKDPTITPVGWPHDIAWEGLMLAGWKRHAAPGVMYKDVYVHTLRTEFDCLADTTRSPAIIYHPSGNSFPTKWQFFDFIKKSIGIDSWNVAKRGAQTTRRVRLPIKWPITWSTCWKKFNGMRNN
jgi:hypothetical protein